MHRVVFLFLALLLLPQRLRADPVRIENIIVTETKKTLLVIIESDRPTNYYVTEAVSPPSIGVHYLEPVDALADLPEISAGKDLLKKIRYKEVRSERTRKVDAIYFDLVRRVPYSVSQKGWTLSLSFDLAGEVEDVRPPVESAAPENPSAQPPEVIQDAPLEPLPPSKNAPTLATLPEDPKLVDFLRVGLANNKKLKITQDEFVLARKKLFEANRTFFPALSARYAQTQGTILTDPTNPSTFADYERREAGLEMGQPIFQSGRIYYHAKQAKMQRDAAELNISRAVQEATYEILRAFFNYLQRRETTLLRQEYYDIAKNIRNTAEKKKSLGIISESEFLGVESALLQAQYRAVSEEKDRDLAENSLLDSLNLQELPQSDSLTLEVELARMKPLKESLDELLAKALSTRPDLRSAYYSAQASKFGRRVARSETLLKVDVSGFIGQSGAAFSNESITMQDSYNVGVKGTLYFGGSSISPLYSKEKTAPDLGSTSRTQTQGQSVSLGILDSLSGSSNLMQAKIDEEKAALELEKAQKQVVMEVKEAYFNFQKALLQLASARSDLAYRTKEVAIARAKDRVNQLDPTQYLSALSGRTDAEVNLKEAMAFALVSYAALEKALGAKL